jgi:hypothetical protein
VNRPTRCSLIKFDKRVAYLAFEALKQMQCNFRLAFAAAAVTVLACSVGCAPLGVSPQITPASAWRSANVVHATVHAFSPGKALIASYQLGVSRETKPIGVLKGARTQLSQGNGMAVDADGTTYAVVYNAASSGSPIKLLVFAPNAHGDAAPERSAVLKGPLLAGYAVGLALDGHGNFWITAVGKLLRYSTSARRVARPNASIALQLYTPGGIMAAHASNVAVDAAGNIYCACTVVFRGAQAIGVSEYALDSRRRASLVRSFYDFSLPEVPPASITVDPKGTIYLASSLPNTGVFAYGPTTKSGDVHYARRFVGPPGTSIFSITNDPAGNVYIATGARILIYGPQANGQAHPVGTIRDPKNLDYTTGDYGTLLEAR